MYQFWALEWGLLRAATTTQTSGRLRKGYKGRQEKMKTRFLGVFR